LVPLLALAGSLAASAAESVQSAGQNCVTTAEGGSRNAARRAAASDSSNYKTPDWNDYSIQFEPSDDGGWSLNEYNDEWKLSENAEGTLTATVVVDSDATLCYSVRGGNGYDGISLRVLLDGVEIRSFNDDQINNMWSSKNHFVELSKGKHTIEWVGSSVLSSYIALENIGVEETPLITVTLLEPGSLGTEILYNVDHLKDVRRLKVIGQLNDDDWDKIEMMEENLFSLDLSEAVITEITNDFFNSNSKNKWPFLHSVKLPEGLVKIGDRAFKNLNIYEINFPSTLECIGECAFAGSNINKALLPENCLTLGEGIFIGCYCLEEASLPSKLTSVPNRMFNDCVALKTFELPSSLQTIGENAFGDCRLTAFDLPESLTRIEYSAFENTYLIGDCDSLIIPNNVTYIGKSAFIGCKTFSYVELPVAFTSLPVNGIGGAYASLFSSNVNTIRLNSPTVVYVESSEAVITSSQCADVTVIVPQFLVNNYKLDDYWYNFKEIKGFSTSEISDWVLNSDVVLGANDRLEGTPTVTINTGGSLKVNGEDPMPISDLTIQSDPGNSAYGRMYSNAYGVTVQGDLLMKLNAKETNKWYFLSLPFNVKVSDIVPSGSATALRAIRYYDGANRAANGATGSWKNFAEDDIIPAGTGFIFQSSEMGYWNVPAQEDATKQYLTSNNVFATALEANAADNTADAGWNLVGNPYQSWYNIHKLNFTAPITVYENNKYAAYSVIDDDYAIAPNQAFFVQCPDGVTSISFPLGGRQMTSTIESQSGAKPHGAQQAESRRIVDLTLTANGDSDRTRIVVNEEASTDYEMNLDASKFMSDVANVSQLYSISGDGTRYAINERPQADGKVSLGFVAGEGGCFSFSLTRNTLGTVTLIDNEQGVSVDLSQQDYDFTADAGTYDNRFELRIGGGETNGIETINSGDGGVKAIDGGLSLGTAAEVYNVGGAKVAEGKAGATISLPAGSYVVKTAAGTAKIAVK